MSRGHRGGAGRGDRTLRLGELIKTICASELERIDDDRLGLFSITEVTVDSDLTLAIVNWSALAADDDEAAEALEEHRARLQAAVSSEARVRRTPILRFERDGSLAEGSRMEEIFRNLPHNRDSEDEGSGADPESP